MSKVQFLNVKTTVGPKGMVSANRIVSKINGQKIDFPLLAASNAYYEKSEKTMRLDAIAYQHHFNINHSHAYDITTKQGQKALLDKVKNNIVKYKPVITDMNLFYGNKGVSLKQIDAFLRIQQDANTTFLSGIEPNRMQNVRSLELQLNALDSMAGKQIPSPTISLKIPKKLLIKKLELILSRGYARFNVEWGGMSRRANLVALSQAIRNKGIICNVVALNSPRQTRKPHLSNISLAFAFGIHSCGIGYPTLNKSIINDNQGTKYVPKCWLFDKNSFMYARATQNPAKCDVVSFNLHQELLREYQRRISSNTLFTGFIPPIAATKINY